jgi:CcmD family protein
MNFLLDPAVAIYVAMAVALAVWLGIFAFLWRIDRATRELHRQLDKPAGPEEPAPRVTLETRRPPATMAAETKTE